ncbi:MAG: hypothetical protein J6Y48_02440 [Clostridia bacterium]|nr:hypothetical protein [Clostridia bacterium]
MSYSKYYQNGWKSGEIGGTPITPAALNHMEDGIVSANDRLDEMKYTFYNTVTDLGLTQGSATILTAYNAMNTNTILICHAGNFDPNELPNVYGTVEICKPSMTSRGYIYFRGKGQNNSDWRMYLGATPYNGNNADLPSGNWVQLPTFDNIYNGLDQSASGFALDARQGKTLNDAMTTIGNGAFNLGTITAGTSKVLQCSTSSHAILILTGPSIDLMGLYLIRIGTTDVPNTVTVKQGNQITFTPATGKITIGNTSTWSMAVNVIPLSRNSSYFSLT